MHYDSLISMNITYKDSILNDKYPILFYWNGISSPIDDIRKDEKILALLKAKITNEDVYDNAKICYATYKFDGENDIYEEKTFNIKDYFGYDTVDDSIKEKIILDILGDVYNKVFGAYPETNWIDSFDMKVNTIVDSIRSHYTKPISKETIINYIRKTYKENHERALNSPLSNEDILVDAAAAVIK